jgi:putative CocE/NonD family hydrolase
VSAGRVEETVWIPLRDGCRLAARIWLPADDYLPAPAILEHLPYRRRDRHRGDDAILHPGLADRGFASVRVDLRGSGDSDGILVDEYTAQEMRDALDVIEWLADEPWCDGAVGMIGLSWSGFNALRVAALRPPALKAIVTTCASDDRYADDMHYMGGCLLHDNLQYGATLLTWLATPPDPAVVGERWTSLWLERLEAIEPPAGRWMAHPTRDDYWTEGAPGTTLDAAVLAVGGWADGYTNAVLRLLATLDSPRKGLIGPWGHAYPHVASPGPRIDFIGYVARWFDHWLRDHDTGIMDEPMLTAWLQEWEPPQARFAQRQGSWIAERVWPSPSVAPRTLHLASDRLQEEPAAVDRGVRSPADTGLASGEWCPYGAGDELPTDQREDDRGSLVFDTGPLEEPLQLLGQPAVTLDLSADTHDGQIAARLEDVAPDGSVARIAYALRNLLLDDDHEHTTPLQPGRLRRVSFVLTAAAYEVPRGHRLRLALSTAYWPLAVPAPVGATVTVHAGALELPVRTPPSSEPVPALGDAWSPPPLGATVLTPLERGRVKITRATQETGETRVDVVRNLGALRIHDVDIDLTALGDETYTIHPDDPASSRAIARRTAALRRGDWDVRIETTSTLSFAADDWRLESSLRATHGDDLVFERSWDVLYPRRGERHPG